MEYIISRIVKRGYIEAIDVIDAWNLNFNLGSCVKYELRLGEKDDEITEIDKAIQYLQFEKEMRIAERDSRKKENEWAQKWQIGFSNFLNSERPNDEVD